MPRRDFGACRSPAGDEPPPYETPGSVQPAPGQSAVTSSPIKGPSVRLLDKVAGDIERSDIPLDCSQHNAVSLEIIAYGANPSAVVTVLGGPSKGGPYLPVIDPNSGATVIVSKIQDIIVGSSWVKIRMGSVSVGSTWDVTGTPYIAPGPTSLVASVN